MGRKKRFGHEVIPDTIAAMKAAGKLYDPVTYDDAGHGFMRAGEAPDASDGKKKPAMTRGSARKVCSRSEFLLEFLDPDAGDF